LTRRNALYKNFTGGTPIYSSRTARLLFTFALFAIRTIEASEPSSGVFDAQIARERALAKSGDTKQARHILEDLIPPLRQKGNSSNLSKALTDLSVVLAGDGDYTKAAKWAEEAKQVSRAMGDRDGEARALDNLGVAQLFLGDYPAAQSSFAAELSVVRALKDAQAEVQAANNLGSAFFYQGSYTQALTQYQAAVSVLNTSNGRPWLSDWRQVTDVNLATLYQRLGELGKALEIYRSVLDSSQKLKSAADQAQLLSNLGALYRHLGDPYKALANYRAALPLLARGHNADGTLGVLLNIGTLYALDRDDLIQAGAYFRNVLVLAAKSRNGAAALKAHLYLGETYLRSLNSDAAASEFTAAEASAVELGIPEDLWQAQYGLGRVAGIRGDGKDAERWFRAAIATIESIRGQILPAELKTEFLAEKRDVYDAMIHLLLPRNDSSAVFDFLERSRARVFQDRVPVQEPLTLLHVQSQLDKGSLVLEFWTAGDQIAVLWITRAGYGIVSQNLSSAQRNRIAKFVGGLPGNLTSDWRQDIQPLREIVPKPFEPFGQSDLKHILVVPDGFLSMIPMELLPISADRVLVEKYDVTYLPTAALLLRAPPAGPRWQFPWKQQLTAFGAPFIGKRSDAASTIFDEDRAALPHSEDEILTISRMLPGRTEAYLGQRDSRRYFEGGAANSAPLLHVSTHAFADLNSPERTRLLFSPADGAAAVDYVFLRELASLDLHHVDMATLSACDTEGGRLVRGEGVEAFSRALLAAGARSTVTTLWRIEDAPAAEFMKQFYYFAALKGQSKSEALRSAKLKLLGSATTLSNPRHWAAFELSGDSGKLMPVFVSWTALLVGSACASVGVIFFLWALGRLWHQQRVHRSNRFGGVVPN
jgi:CHAT domain-containing protein/tetratricopeptide (TPR) repeat protein